MNLTPSLDDNIYTVLKKHVETPLADADPWALINDMRGLTENLHAMAIVNLWDDMCRDPNLSYHLDVWEPHRVILMIERWYKILEGTIGR